MEYSNKKSLELPIIKEHIEEENKSKKLNETLKSYHVSEYDNLCGDYAKIEKIIPIRYNYPFLILYILLNILTLGIFSFFFSMVSFT